MSETELPAYLMNLEPEQLEQVRKMLVQRIEDQQQQKLKQRSLPPAFHDSMPLQPIPDWTCPA